MKNILVLLFCSLALYSCKKEGCTNEHATNYDQNAKEDDCSCTTQLDKIDGTYTVTVTRNSAHIYNQGDEFDVLVFLDLPKCQPYDPADIKSIKFNNLFTFFGCDQYPFEDYTFTVSLDDRDTWNNAPIEGTGSIKNGIFHFEGFIHTSSGKFPVEFDGIKTSSERRTDAC